MEGSRFWFQEGTKEEPQEGSSGLTDMPMELGPHHLLRCLFLPM